MIEHSLVRTTKSKIVNGTLYDIDIEYTKTAKLFGITFWSRYYKTNGDISLLNDKQPIGLRQHEKTD